MKPLTQKEAIKRLLAGETLSYLPSEDEDHAFPSNLFHIEGEKIIDGDGCFRTPSLRSLYPYEAPVEPPKQWDGWEEYGASKPKILERWYVIAFVSEALRNPYVMYMEVTAEDAEKKRKELGSAWMDTFYLRKVL